MSKIPNEPLDLATSAKRINGAITHMRMKHKLVTTALEAMKRFDGKPISKRLETAVQAVLPDSVVSYRNEYGMFKLFIWGKDTPYSDRIDLLIGYSTNGVYSHDDMINEKRGYAIGYLNLAETADKYEAVKAGLPGNIKAYNSARIAYIAATKVYDEAVSIFAPAAHTIFEKAP